MKVFDAHLHVIDPRFPLVANQGYLPEPFPVAAYRAVAEPLGVVGGAVVSGSFQGFDQAHLRHALATLGPGFVGVAQVPLSVDDDEIRDLDRAGVRAVRFNFRRGGSVSSAELERIAGRIHDIAGWHVELYVEPEALDALAPLLIRLPRVVIDHLGLAQKAFPTLRALVERGVRVKASGFGRLDFEPVAAVRELLALAPRSVVFGSDLPSTRAPRPFAAEDLERLLTGLDTADAERVALTNACDLYRLIPGLDAEKS